MLELFGKLSKKLQPLRRFSYFLVIILVVGIVIYLLQPTSHQQPSSSYAILSFVACIWLLLFNLLLSIFDNVPTVDTQAAKFKRLKIKIQRCIYQLLAVLFTGLTLIIIFLTIRMLRV